MKVGVHFGPWSLRSLVTSVLRPNWTSSSDLTSVLGHFGPKDRTDLANSVLKLSVLCTCILLNTSLLHSPIIHHKEQLHFLTKKDTYKIHTKNILKTFTK